MNLKSYRLFIFDLDNTVSSKPSIGRLCPASGNWPDMN